MVYEQNHIKPYKTSGGKEKPIIDRYKKRPSENWVEYHNRIADENEIKSNRKSPD